MESRSDEVVPRILRDMSPRTWCMGCSSCPQCIALPDLRALPMSHMCCGWCSDSSPTSAAEAELNFNRSLGVEQSSRLGSRIAPSSFSFRVTRVETKRAATRELRDHDVSLHRPITARCRISAVQPPAAIQPPPACGAPQSASESRRWRQPLSSGTRSPDCRLCRPGSSGAVKN